MASKYSALPDIDDQPDVYETPDADEAESSQFQNRLSDDDDDNENVIRANLSVKDASSRFKDAIVETTGTDTLTRRKKAMYRSFVRRPRALDTSEYEILPKDLELQETPLQKLRRLMYEAQELSKEIERKEDESANESSVSQADLLSQIVYLQSDLARLGQRLGDKEPDGVANTSAYSKHIDDAKQLIKQLEAYKSLPVKNSEENQDDTVVVDKNDKGDVVTYELYYTPEAAKLHKENRLAEVDERIAKLESLIGTNAASGLDGLPSTLASTSLIGLLTKFEQQITVLVQPKQLEMIGRRVKVLIGELERLNDLKTSRKDASLGFGLVGTPVVSGGAAPSSGAETMKENGLSANTEEKVNHLFNTLDKIDPLLNLTPALLTRLKAIQSLHTEAATFARSVKVISEEQNRIEDELKNLSETVDQLNKSLKDNENTVQNNINVIDVRMTELVQRVAALSTSPITNQ